MNAMLSPGEWPSLLRRQWVRWRFNALRPTVYEGLVNILNAPLGSSRPLWSDVFNDWALRAKRRGNKQHAWLYGSVALRLAQGQSLSQALRPFVPVEDALIIETGERTGDFAQALQMLATSYDTEKAITAAAAGAFRAPAGSFLGFLGISYLMGAKFWPPMLESVSEQYWDGWAMPMVHFQIWLASHLWAPLPFLLLYGAYRYSKTHWAGRVRTALERVPMSPYAIARDQVAAKFLLVLASLMGARLLMEKGLEVIARSSSPYLRYHIALIRHRKEAYPTDLARMINTGLFNDQLLDRISNASVGVQPDVALKHIGNTAMASVTDIVRKRANAAGTALNAIVGLLFVWYSAVLVIGFQVANDRMVQAQRVSAAPAQQVHA